MSGATPAYAHALPSTVAQCKVSLAGPGQALAPDLRAPFETALATDLSGVRIHTGAAAGAASERAGARAFAMGQDIGFGSGEFQPQTPRGRALLGHELVHVAQSQRGGGARRALAEAEADTQGPRAALGLGAPVHSAAPDGVAFSVDKYFDSTPNIREMSLTQVQQDLDEIAEYMDRQFETDDRVILLEQARDLLLDRKAELLHGVTNDPPTPRKGRRRGRKQRQKAAAEAAAPLPEDAPRILRERTSMPTDDPGEVAQEVDRIVAWLQRPDVSRDDRAILRDELQALAPQREEARQQEAAERQGARVQASFQRRGGGGGEADDLRPQLRIVESIYTDPAEPEARFILNDGERIRISKEQADGLVNGTRTELKKAITRARDMADIAVNAYQAQTEINDDQVVVSTIAGWLGGVDDPGMAVIIGKTRTDMGVQIAESYLKTGHLVKTVEPLMQAAEAAAKLKRAVNAWRDGLMEGASLAVGALTFIRDASFAIAGAIAAVVAAPLVAGYAAGLGLGAAGTTLVTTAGTGLVVGTGSAVAGGGAEYAGQRLAGASHDEAASAAGTQAKRRFAEGAASGIGGGATRVAGQALRVGGNVGNQFVRRAGAEAAGNFLGTTSGGVLQGQDVGDSAFQGVRSAGFGVVGNAFGSLGRSPATREVLEFGTNAVTSSADTLAHGGSASDVFQNLSVMAATQGAVSRSPGAQRQMAGIEQAGRNAGQSHRRAAQNTIGAVGLGVQMSLPPNGFGGTSRPLSTLDSAQIGRRAAPRRGGETAPQITPRPEQAPRPAAAQDQTTLGTASRDRQAGEAVLDLDRRPHQDRGGAEINDPSARDLGSAADIGPIPELDTRPWQERGPGQTHDPSMIDLGDATGPDLQIDRRQARRSARPRRDADFGRDTGIVTGTEHRSGMNFNEFNAAEIGQTRLRVRRGERGRTEVVTFRLTAEAVASTQSTSRSFAWDPSTGGPQAVSSDYTNSGFDRGHLAPREAASLDSRFVDPEFQGSHAEIQSQAERAMDQMANVVPMDPEFNQHGAWRQAEQQANRWATRDGHIEVEIRPHYGDNPRRLPSGLDVPDGFIRIERRPNGRIIRRRYYPNE